MTEVQWTLIYPAARIIRTPNFPGIAICMLVFWPWWYTIIGAQACLVSKNGYPPPRDT